LIDVFIEPDQLQVVLHALLPLRLRHVGAFEHQTQVLANGFPWQQARALKHVADQWALLLLAVV
jgi:hypothetical protein